MLLILEMLTYSIKNLDSEHFTNNLYSLGYKCFSRVIRIYIPLIAKVVFVLGNRVKSLLV